MLSVVINRVVKGVDAIFVDLEKVVFRAIKGMVSKKAPKDLTELII